MAKLFYLSGLTAALLLAGCQAVNTTSGGAVGVERKQYMFSMLSSSELNQMYAQSYQQTLSEAQQKGVLDKNSTNARRVDAIARRLIAQTPVFRPDAAQWAWEAHVIDSDELNANCGPGGKIIVYSGLIDKLKLTDDELAAVMGHEFAHTQYRTDLGGHLHAIGLGHGLSAVLAKGVGDFVAHALREHSREAMSKAYGVQMANQIGSVLGVGQAGLGVANAGVEYLMTLPNSRSNENEADLIGLELSARAGYNPNAAISLWKKMEQAGGGAPPEFMSTHPSSTSRMAALEAAIPKVMPFYEQAKGQR